MRKRDKEMVSMLSSLRNPRVLPGSGFKVSTGELFDLPSRHVGDIYGQYFAVLSSCHFYLFDWTALSCYVVMVGVSYRPFLCHIYVKGAQGRHLKRTNCGSLKSNC